MAFDVKKMFEGVRLDASAKGQAMKVAELALWTALADGELDSGELEAVVAQLRNLPGLAALSDTAASSLISGLRKHDSPEKAAVRVAELSAAIVEPRLRRLAYQLALHCAAADGIITEEEEKILEVIKELFQIGAEESAKLSAEVLGG